ncbi:ion channel TACAN-like [Patiria miniata]|uniref:Transmembrane protein 120A n=1 Tax=Patiria miniata TaxID=46514 RepID=A0A914A5K9_PATMI|nr:ion channel TACAN-like [Patiria miniata]
MANTMLLSLAEELDDLNVEFVSLQEKSKEYQKTLETLRTIEKSCMSMVTHQKKKYTQIGQTLKKHGKDLGLEDKPRWEELQRHVAEKQKVCVEIHESLPRPSEGFLKLTLGQVSVSLLSKSEKFDYKEEYERFKLYMTIILLVFSLATALFIDFRVCDALFHFLLVWYYCTLVIRESILRHNGSRIKGWWVLHHYLSVVLCGILLIWPASVSYEMFRNLFMAFSVYLNFLQLLQYYYQSGCLYRLRALGEKSDMYLTVEGFQEWMWRGLQFLLPFLMLGYIFQAYNAFVLFKLSFHPECNEWMVPASAIIFFILFLGNFFTTSKVMLSKFQAMQKKKSKKSL